MRRARALAAVAIIAALGSAFAFACTNDFDALEPVADGGATVANPDAAPGSDSGAVPVDSGGNVDGGSPFVDAFAPGDAGIDGMTPVDATTPVDGAPCTPSPACISNAATCATNCVQTATTCLMQCNGANPNCVSKCQMKETNCRNNCSSTCTSCTQAAGCADPLDCADAASQD